MILTTVTISFSLLSRYHCHCCHTIILTVVMGTVLTPVISFSLPSHYHIILTAVTIYSHCRHTITHCCHIILTAVKIRRSPQGTVLRTPASRPRARFSMMSCSKIWAVFAGRRTPGRSASSWKFACTSYEQARARTSSRASRYDSYPAH